jgi:cytochrome c5
MKMKWMLGLLLMLGTVVSLALDPEHQLLINRVQPLGSVRVEGGDAVQQAAAPTKTQVRTGEQIYNQHCSVCHASGVAGAPKFHDDKDWHERLEKKGISGLVKSVTNGLNAMPPMGTCQTCTQEEFKHAVEYMLPK